MNESTILPGASIHKFRAKQPAGLLLSARTTSTLGSLSAMSSITSLAIQQGVTPRSDPTKLVYEGDDALGYHYTGLQFPTHHCSIYCSDFAKDVQ